jgi:hypothetical protein
MRLHQDVERTERRDAGNLNKKAEFLLRVG